MHAQLAGAVLDPPTVPSAALASLSPEEAARLLPGFRPSLFGFIRRKGFSPEEADDLTQETLIRAYLHLAGFRGSMLDAWLFRIAANVCVDHVRRRRIATVPLDAVSAIDAGDEAHADRLVRSERRACVRLVIADLPECHQRILRLRYFEDRSLAEIAAEVNCSTMAAKLRVFRAVTALRKRWRAVSPEADTAPGIPGFQPSLAD